MGRDTLGLADDSLFVEKIKHTFNAADADLSTRGHACARKKLSDGSSTGCKAADLLFDQNADATTIAGAFLAPLLWNNQTDIGHIREHFGSDAATALEDLRDSLPIIELLHQQVFRDHLVIFGNGGRIVRLAENATVQDYLKIINAHMPRDAPVKVNGRVAALDCALRDGDSIAVAEDGPAVGSHFAEVTA